RHTIDHLDRDCADNFEDYQIVAIDQWHWQVPLFQSAWLLLTFVLGFAYASACVSQSVVYSSWQADTATTCLASSASTFLAANITTLCDGYPRVVGTVTPTSTSYSFYNGSTAITGVMPICTIAGDDCSRYKSSWTSASEAYNTLVSAYYTWFTLDAAATALTTGNDLIGYSTIKLNGSNTSLPTLTINNLKLTPSPPAIISGCTGCASSSYYRFAAWQQVGSIRNASLISEDQDPYYIMPGTRWVVHPPLQEWPGAWQHARCAATQESTDSDSCGPCTIHGGNVRLYYFPVTDNASRNQCASTTTDTGTVCPFGRTIPVTATNDGSGPGPDQQPCSYYPMSLTSVPDSGSSMIFNGQTFYANKAYISLEEVYATNGCGQVGQKHGGTILALQSSDIYSIYDAGDPMYAYTNFRTATSFNFADLNPNVPGIAYNGAKGCRWEEPPGPAITSAFYGINWHGHRLFGVNINGQRYNECQIIMDAGYAPVLAVPPQILTIDPEWSSCALNLNGLYDPPHPLEAATSEFGVSMITLKASPASSATSPGAPKTTEATATSTSLAQDTGSLPSTAQPASTLLWPGSSTLQPESISRAQGAASDSTAVNDPAQATGSRSDHSTDIDQATTVLFDFGRTSNSAVNTHGSVLEDPVSEDLRSAPAESSIPGASPDVTTVVVGSQLYTVSKASNSQVVVNDGTLPADNAETIIDGQTMQNADPSGIIIESSTIIVAQLSGTVLGSGNALVPAATTAVVESQAITISEAGQSAVVIDGETVSAGQSELTMDGQTVKSIDSTELLIGTSTIGLPTTDDFVTAPGDGQDSAATTALIGSQVFTISRADSSELVVNGVTLVASGTHAIVDGQTVAAIGVSGVIIGASTIAIPAAARTSEDPSITFMASGQAFTATKGSNGVVFIGSAVLSSGAETIIDGVTISAGGSDLVLDGTSTLSFSMQSKIAVPHAAATFGAGGEVFTASEVQVTSGKIELAAIAVGSTTIVPGQQLTLDGVVISAGNDGLVIGNTATVALLLGSSNYEGFYVS
ncbi:hypothetical protein Tdes44962_MAKER07383, partial [Teratosphaeria destructans]